MVLFQKLGDGESSDKVLSWRANIKLVTWQLFSKFCSLSVRETRWSQNVTLGPVETCKLSFRLYIIITYRLFALPKTDEENCNTYLCITD